MPKKRNPAFSKKVKKRAPIREAFKQEFVDGNPTILSVRFTHWENKDWLYVTVTPEFYMDLPEEYMGYPIFVKHKV